METTDRRRAPPARGNRLGASCAILVGVLYVFLIIYVVAIPSGQRYDAGQFFENYAQRSLAMSIAWIVMAATSLLAFAVVPAVNALVRSESEQWIQLANIVGLVGFATSAVSFLTMLGRAPGLAQAYVEGDRATKAAIAAIGLPQLDPLNVLVLGGVGVWYLVVNVLALRGGKLAKLHAVCGVAIAVFLWLAVLAAMIRSELLDQIAAGAGALLAPTWYIWMGIRLLRASGQR